MLEREDVANLTRHWHKTPSERSCKKANIYIEQFFQDDSLAIFSAGLSAMALYTENIQYKELSTATFEIGLERGLAIEKLMPWHVPEDGVRGCVHNVEAASSIVSKLQQEGKKTGFLHGHFRMLTPANWANTLIARERCDSLILGLEDGWRTKKHKGVEPAARDWQRWQWILASGFDGHLVKISRYPYTESGYLRILKQLNPDIYFGNFSIPQERDEQMQRRAILCNVNYVRLPEQSGFHTSDYTKNS
jgi:hypothetical protein